MKYKFLDVNTSVADLKTKIWEYIGSKIQGFRRSESNVFVATIDTISDVTTLGTDYAEKILREMEPDAAVFSRSIRAMAAFSGYQSIGPIASRGSFVLKSGRGFRTVNARITSDKGIVYTVEDGKWVDGAEIIGIQGEYKEISSTLGTLEDGALWVINLEGVVDQDSIEVNVLGRKYEKVDSVWEMNPNVRCYMLRNDFGAATQIVFGNAAHGIQLKTGDVVTVKYIEHLGVEGNINGSETFEVSDGFFEVDGNVFDGEITVVSVDGFSLGSNGESKETVRKIIGYSSRSLTFARPENLRAFLARFTGIRYARVWTVPGSNPIFYVLVTKKNLLKTEEFLSGDDSLFLFSTSWVNQLRTQIENSKRMYVGTEMVFVTPSIKRYCLMVYVEGNVEKSDIEDAVVLELLRERNLDDDYLMYRRLDMLEVLSKVRGVKNLNLHYLSQDNENARIIGEYRDSAGKLVVLNGDDPRIGLNELGDVKLENSQILRLSPIEKFESLNTSWNTGRGVVIFRKGDDGIWKKL